MRTNSAVAKVRWPPSRRRPTATATSATEKVASSSRTSEERKATRSVAMVAVPVAVGDVADGGGLGLGPPEDLEGRQPGHHVEEVAGQPLEELGLSPHAALGRGPHQGHEQRDERDGDGDDGRRDPVGPQHHDDDGDRDDHRQKELGQVTGEVAVEGVDPAGGQDVEAAGALGVDAGRAQRADLLDQGLAQVRLGRRRRPVGQPLAEPRQGGPHGDHHQEQADLEADLGQVAVVGRPPGRSCWRSARPGPGPGRR